MMFLLQLDDAVTGGTPEARGARAGGGSTAAAGGSSAGAAHPFRRMSPGVGRRPTPPPLLRLQGYAAPALDPPALPRASALACACRKTCPVADGRLLAK